MRTRAMSPAICRNCDNEPAISTKHDDLTEWFSIICFRCRTTVTAADYETALEIWNGEPRFKTTLN